MFIGVPEELKKKKVTTHISRGNLLGILMQREKKKNAGWAEGDAL